MRPGRRLLAFSSAVLVTVALLGPVLVLAAENTSDSFGSGDYGGGTGSWVGNWTESGEATSHTGGVIRVVSTECETSSCVRFDSGLLLLAGPYSLSRVVDLQGAESASLTFEYQKSGVAVFQVWTRPDKDSGWTQHTLANSPSWTSRTFSVGDNPTGSAEVLFRISGLAIGATAYIDDIEITPEFPPATTTTTTTTSSTTTLPITTTTIDLPITTTTITIPLPTTTTSTTTTTTVPTSTNSSTSTTTPETDSTLPPGDGGPGAPPPEIPIDPITPEEVELAAQSNIAIDLTDGSDFQSFGLGVNPLTDLSVRLLSTVETISSEIVSALLLGGAIAIFAIRRIKDDGDDPIPPT